MIATEIAEKAQSGTIDPLKAYVDLKMMEAELQQALKSVQPLAISEADKWAEKSFQYAGVIIEKRAAPATWDYSGVRAYAEAKERLSYVEQIAKAGGGMDSSGNEIEKAVKIEGRASIAIKIPKA